MSADAPEPAREARVRTMQIIAGAIPLGAVIALTVLYLVRSQNSLPPREPPIVSYVCLGVAAVALVNGLIAPVITLNANRRRLAAQPDSSATPAGWYALYQTLLLIRLAAF